MNKLSEKRILIADDEPSVRSLVRRFLSDYVVLDAEDGEEAVRIALSQKPDLILMDIMMPRVDGYTACYTIKAEPISWGIPIVMLTALDHKLNVKFGKDMGADGYITKPFTRKDVLDMVGQLLRSAKEDIETQTTPTIP